MIINYLLTIINSVKKVRLNWKVKTAINFFFPLFLPLPFSSLLEMKNRFVPTEYCKRIPSDSRNDHTYLSLETFVLLEDIPIPWLINYVQRWDSSIDYLYYFFLLCGWFISSWPINTVKSFSKTIERYQDLSHQRFSQWHWDIIEGRKGV